VIATPAGIVGHAVPNSVAMARKAPRGRPKPWRHTGIVGAGFAGRYIIGAYRPDPDSPEIHQRSSVTPCPWGKLVADGPPRSAMKWDGEIRFVDDDGTLWSLPKKGQLAEAVFDLTPEGYLFARDGALWLQHRGDHAVRLTDWVPLAAHLQHKLWTATPDGITWHFSSGTTVEVSPGTVIGFAVRTYGDEPSVLVLSEDRRRLELINADKQVECVKSTVRIGHASCNPVRNVIGWQTEAGEVHALDLTSMELLYSWKPERPPPDGSCTRDRSRPVASCSLAPRWIARSPRGIPVMRSSRWTGVGSFASRPQGSSTQPDHPARHWFVAANISVARPSRMMSDTRPSIMCSRCTPATSSTGDHPAPSSSPTTWTSACPSPRYVPSRRPHLRRGPSSPRRSMSTSSSPCTHARYLRS
jgi:hypothetical protein